MKAFKRNQQIAQLKKRDSEVLDSEAVDPEAVDPDKFEIVMTVEDVEKEFEGKSDQEITAIFIDAFDSEEHGVAVVSVRRI